MAPEDEDWFMEPSLSALVNNCQHPSMTAESPHHGRFRGMGVY
jgi:hypothetical protein